MEDKVYLYLVAASNCQLIARRMDCHGDQRLGLMANEAVFPNVELAGKFAFTSDVVPQPKALIIPGARH